MKNRKTLIVAVMLVAVLCAGVGFASVNDELTINGAASVAANQGAFDEYISFKSGTVVVENAKDSVDFNADDDTNDTMDLVCGSLTNKGDSATFRFVVQNTGDVAATIAPEVSAIANNDGYFSVSHTMSSGATLAAKTGDSNGELTFDVTVTLVRTPTEAKEATFALTLTATSVD